jgi:cyclophilin family peptidyl-prolyl cis-trans isomerase
MQISRLSRFAGIIFIALATTMALGLQTSAQDQAAGQAAASGNAKAARAEFDRVFGEWREMLGALAELQDKYQKAGEPEKAAIEKQYSAIAAKGEKLSERLKAATEAAYAANPNDTEVRQLLTRMAATAMRDDQYEEAERLARLGLAHRPNDQQFAGMAANAAYNLNKFAEAEKILKAATGEGALSVEAQKLLASAEEYIPLWQQEQKLRSAEATADDLPRVKLQTSKGDIVVELFENQAPNTVANFISLVEKGYYDGVLFHRVLPGFMAQGGDPTGTGGGGPGYTIKDEVDRADARMHFRGSLSMAKTMAPDSGGSQFFLTFKPTPHLNKIHTVFGRVIEGFDVLAKLNRVQPTASGEPPPNADKIVKATVIRKRNHPYQPEKLPE